MRRYLALAALGFCLWALPRGSVAHHVSGHGGGGSNYFNPFSSSSRPPRTFLSFTLGVDSLDAGLGEVIRYQLAGEYAFNRRFSAGLRLPFLSVREKFLPNSDSIGDVALGLKGLLWSRPQQRKSLSLGTGFSFPTGNESRGLGAGVVLASPYLNYTMALGPVDFYSTMGTTVAMASEPAPSLDYNTGFNIPLIKGGDVPVNFFVALQGSTSFSDDVFTAGSTKAYLTPGFILFLRQNLIATFGARVSVIDTLTVKPDIALAKSSTALLSDVEAGFNFNIDYFF